MPLISLSNVALVTVTTIICPFLALCGQLEGECHSSCPRHTSAKYRSRKNAFSTVTPIICLSINLIEVKLSLYTWVGLSLLLSDFVHVCLIVSTYRALSNIRSA